MLLFALCIIDGILYLKSNLWLWRVGNLGSRKFSC